MDCRFNIDVKFSIYGQDFDWKASLNWSPYCPGDIDHRIAEWFLECHNTAYAKWVHETVEQESEMRAAKEKEQELAELKRLHEKYPHALPGIEAAKTLKEKTKYSAI